MCARLSQLVLSLFFGVVQWPHSQLLAELIGAERGLSEALLSGGGFHASVSLDSARTVR